MLECQKKKKSDLNDFEDDMVIGERWAGLNISLTADHLGFVHITVSRVYTKWYEEQKSLSEWQFCEFVDKRGLRRMT